MTVFDTTLEVPEIQEGNLDPILPEQRFVFELVGFERSGPDQFRPRGGIKWTFDTWNEDGTPFLFQDEQYQLWRTTNINANGEPLFNIGTQAHEWACALLGRQLGVDEKFSVSELRNKRMSAMVVWRNKRPPAKGKTFDLASLRHVPVANAAPGRRATKTADPQPGFDANGDPLNGKAHVALLQQVKDAARKAEVLQTPKHLDWMGLNFDDLSDGDLMTFLDQIKADILAG